MEISKQCLPETENEIYGGTQVHKPTASM